jgi:hypothetical protein
MISFGKPLFAEMLYEHLPSAPKVDAVETTEILLTARTVGWVRGVVVQLIDGKGHALVLFSRARRSLGATLMQA